MVITPPSISPAPPGEGDAAPDAELAARVASGPGFWTDWLEELDRQGLLEELLADDVIARALRFTRPYPAAGSESAVILVVTASSRLERLSRCGYCAACCL